MILTRKRLCWLFLKILCGGALALISIIGAATPTLYEQYKQCSAGKQQFFDDYMSIKRELSNRRYDIAAQIIAAKSISMLRNTYDERKYFSIKYKDYSMSELEESFAIKSELVDLSGMTGQENAAIEAFSKEPLYTKYYNRIFHGHIETTLSNSDLLELKMLAAAVTYIEFSRLVLDVITINDAACHPRALVIAMFGDKPVMLRRFQYPGSAVDKERQRIENKRIIGK